MEVDVVLKKYILKKTCFFFELYFGSWWSCENFILNWPFQCCILDWYGGWAWPLIGDVTGLLLRSSTKTSSLLKYETL